MRVFTIIITAALTCPFSYGQQSATQVREAPKTQLEAFAAETGAVIIKGYSELGKVSGMGSVEVDCREFTNASNRKKTWGILIEVTESSRLERNSKSFIDYDEIESLIEGIDYIGRIDSSVTRLPSFEATYTTRGDFAVTVYNNSAGKLSVAVSSGRIGRATAFIGIEKLDELRALITRGKATLDELRN